LRSLFDALVTLVDRRVLLRHSSYHNIQLGLGVVVATDFVYVRRVLLSTWIKQCSVKVTEAVTTRALLKQ
jgi:hypothetical protein